MKFIGESDSENEKYDLYQLGNVIACDQQHYMIVGRPNNHYSLIHLETGLVQSRFTDGKMVFDTLKELADASYNDGDRLVRGRYEVKI